MEQSGYACPANLPRAAQSRQLLRCPVTFWFSLFWCFSFGKWNAGSGEAATLSLDTILTFDTTFLCSLIFPILRFFVWFAGPPSVSLSSQVRDFVEEKRRKFITGDGSKRVRDFVLEKPVIKFTDKMAFMFGVRLSASASFLSFLAIESFWSGSSLLSRFPSYSIVFTFTGSPFPSPSPRAQPDLSQISTQTRRRSTQR